MRQTFGTTAGRVQVAGRPGWGFLRLALVALAVLVAFGCGPVPQTKQSVSPAGPWLTESASGTGTLRGWDMDVAGIGVDAPDDAFAYFKVGARDSSGGTSVVHSARVYVTKATRVVVAGRSEAATAVFSDQGPRVEALGGRLLSVTFHRVDGAIVADWIDAAEDSASSPFGH